MALHHIFFTAIPAWGHIRSFCVFAGRLVQEREDVVVTLLLSSKTLDKADNEVAAEICNNIHFQDTRKRVRILSTVEASSADPFQASKEFMNSFLPTYQALMAGRSITCAASKTVYEAWPPPTLAVIDFFAFSQFNAICAISKNKIPIVAWVSCHAAFAIRLFGPEAMGGSGDVAAKLDLASTRLGVPVDAPGEKLWLEVSGTSGSVIKLPGVPGMYDYEFFPQSLPFDQPLSTMIKGSYGLLQECDAVLTANIHAWESESIKAMREWFSASNKEVYAFGPLLPVASNDVQHLGNSDGSEVVKSFLDSMLEDYGKHSTILISFGTIYWPSNTDYLEETVNILIEKRFPFILVYASPFSELGNKLKEIVLASGIGLLTTWCPQQYILNHPATGWFLTHCGFNSVTEALGSGVPMIAWPFQADQPTIASQLESLHLAVELVEVRNSGYATRPLLRRNGKTAKGTKDSVGAEIRQLIDACRGPRGSEITNNVRKMKKEFQRAWETDGEARKDFDSFVRKYLTR